MTEVDALRDYALTVLINTKNKDMKALAYCVAALCVRAEDHHELGAKSNLRPIFDALREQSVLRRPDAERLKAIRPKPRKPRKLGEDL